MMKAVWAPATNYRLLTTGYRLPTADRALLLDRQLLADRALLLDRQLLADRA